LKEGCGSAKELRNSTAGLACTNQKGKAIGNVFLITTLESDKCAVVGVEKDKIQESAEVVTEKVQADLKINLPALEAARASDADKLVNATSCSAFGSTPKSVWLKIGVLIFELCLLVLFGNPVWQDWVNHDESMSGIQKVLYTLTVKFVVVIFLFVVTFHPLWIIFLTGCFQYQMACWYELGLTSLDCIILFCENFFNFNLLAWFLTCSLCKKKFQNQEEVSNFGKFAIGSLIVRGVWLASDIWGLADSWKFFCDQKGLEIATLVLNCVDFLVKLFSMIFLSCLRDSFGVSETEPKSDDRVVGSSLGSGGGRMPGQDGAADAPAEGDAHSEGSAFSDHESQDGNTQDAARKADEDKDTPYSQGGQPIACV
jgi:hypothetical protein